MRLQGMLFYWGYKKPRRMQRCKIKDFIKKSFRRVVNKIEPLAFYGRRGLLFFYSKAATQVDRSEPA
jgi:hypothetical protein